MARMPRGEPQSVPDPNGDDYDAMMRRWLSGRDVDSPGATSGARRSGGRRPPNQTAVAPPTARPPARPNVQDPHRPVARARPFIGYADPLDFALNPGLAATRDVIAGIQKAPRVGHPGTLESFIPIWGSGREAVADLQEGDYLGGALNAGLAVTDAIPAKAVAGALEKGAWKAGSHTWSATRKWLGKRGYADFGQEMHHWGIPQGGWGKIFPDWAKNSLLNLKAMPSPEIHRLVHDPRANPFLRYHYGTPDWWKASKVSAGGRGVDAWRHRDHR